MEQATTALVMATVAFISIASATEAKKMPEATPQKIVEQSKGQTVYFNAWGGVNRSMIILTGLPIR
ncbi:hypothetical protein [Endozoicomonas sp. YOMI1]|uniref:hypothetical protein n=1 Tax=Endozoicomonas sp. YOMI1 TaxID=2828739 RepID=UPI0021485CAD|nr:hypothetical protein [Endozoicomonas sp. YOMI1]